MSRRDGRSGALNEARANPSASEERWKHCPNGDLDACASRQLEPELLWDPTPVFVARCNGESRCCHLGIGTIRQDPPHDDPRVCFLKFAESWAVT